MMRRLWGILIGWLLSLAFALNTGRDLAWNIFYLITATILLSALWAYTNVNWVRVGRFTRARRAQVGKLAEEQFEVRNLSRLPKLWLEVRDFSTLPGHHASHVVSSLGGQRRQRWMVRTVCQQGGRFMLGPLTLSSGDPLTEVRGWVSADFAHDGGHSGLQPAHWHPDRRRCHAPAHALCHHQRLRCARL